MHFAGNPNPYTSIETYGRYIEKFYETLKKKFPAAKVYFATTPVSEHLQGTTSYRRNSEIAEYNSLAKNILRGKVDSFDDLFSIASMIGDEYRASDGLHFSEEGAKVLADAVYRFLYNNI